MTKVASHRSFGKYSSVLVVRAASSVGGGVCVDATRCAEREGAGETFFAMDSSKRAKRGAAGAYAALREAEAEGRRLIGERTAADNAQAAANATSPLSHAVFASDSLANPLEPMQLSDPDSTQQQLGQDSDALNDNIRRATVAVGVLTSLDLCVRDDFVQWLRGQDIVPPFQHSDLSARLHDWRSSPEYQHTKTARIAEQCTCADNLSCICTYDGESATVDIPGVTCDYYDGLNSLGDLLNYGTRPGEWTPNGPVPEPVRTVPFHLQMLDTPEVTSFCMSCGTLRPHECGLSHVGQHIDGSLRRFANNPWCRQCRNDMNSM